MWIRTCQVQIDELTQFMEEDGRAPTAVSFSNEGEVEEGDGRDETALSFGISLQAATAEGICSLLWSGESIGSSDVRSKPWRLNRGNGV